jgi:hypothetical protein
VASPASWLSAAECVIRQAAVTDKPATVPSVNPAAESRTRWLSFAATAVVFMLACVTRADADLWGHLRYGLDILRDGGLTSVDPYSFTQDKPWVNHEWLSELLMGLAWSLAESTGLIFMKAAMLTGVVAIVWRGLDGASHVARFWIMVGVAFGTIHVSSSIRPQVWTILAVAVLCRALVGDRARDLRWLPLLFAIWVNCHGGWIVGLGILGVWAAVDSIARPERIRGWALLVLSSTAATLVNPYGWGLWGFIAETVRVTRNITEWGPLWGTPWLNWLPWIAATIGIGWFVRLPSPQRWPVAAVLAMLAYGSLRVMRIESIYVTAAALLLAPALRARWPGRDTTILHVIRQHERVVAAGLLGSALLVSYRSDFRSAYCIGVWSSTRPDQHVLPVLEHARPGRLVTFFDWGQYALWHLGPELKVSMDGRRETVYSDRRLEEHDAILAGADDGLRALADWRAEYVWLPASSTKTAAWLRANGYRIDVETDRSFVAVREDLPTLPRPSATHSQPPACFPG